MSIFFASLRRELQLRLRQPASVLHPMAFAILVALMVGFAVGAQPAAMTLLAPAALYIALLLAMFLALDQLFAGDVHDGTLDALLCSAHTLIPVLYGKAFGFWLSNCLSILLALPVLLVLLKLPMSLAPVITLSLLLSSLAMSFLGLAGAALTCRVQQESSSAGALLLLILIIPQAVPVLIFALGAISAASVGEAFAAPMYFLGAICMAYVTAAPWVAKLALRG